MSNIAEIVFMGLCSLLNVQNTPDVRLPPPSVVLPTLSDHKAMLAYDSLAVTVHAEDGAGRPITPIDAGKRFKYFPLADEELVVANAPGGVPRPALSLAAVPSMHAYSPESKNDKWDPDIIPGRKNGVTQKPRRGSIAAFMVLSAGELSAGAVTGVPFEFRTLNDDKPTIRGHFANEVIYTFAEDEIVIAATEIPKMPNDPEVTRTFRFAALPGAMNTRVWVANLPCNGCSGEDIERGLTNDFDSIYEPSEHYAHHYHSLARPPKAVVRIPYPILPDPPPAQPKVAKVSEPGDDDSGYCGPDQRP